MRQSKKKKLDKKSILFFKIIQAPGSISRKNWLKSKHNVVKNGVHKMHVVNHDKTF